MIFRSSIDVLTVVAITLLAIVASALLLVFGDGRPAAVAHLLFAVGVLPLIFAAMLHFVPVLTRTGDPGKAMRRLPFFAQLAGLTAVLGLLGHLPEPALSLAALVDLLLAGCLLRWLRQRARATLGTPHPGWRWYAAALVCLMLALLAVLAMALWPEYWLQWRLFHLHLNTQGLIGLAALGTMPVLLPTALGQPDPSAAHYLRRRLGLALLAVLLLAFGSAVYWPLSIAGGAALLIALTGLGLRWRAGFGARRLLADGAAVALVGALCGWLLCLFAGALHAAGLLAARPTLAAWIAAFLLPLLSGALTQLLPVWACPGPRTPAREQMRAVLAAWGQVRTGLFLLAGIAWLAAWPSPAMVLQALAALLFVLPLLQALRILRSTR